jgi:hypothetical protein
MADAHLELEDSIAEVGKARNMLGRSNGKQVRAANEVAHLKSVSYAWFRTHRVGVLQAGIGEASLLDVDEAYKLILDATQRDSSRATYLDALRRAKDALAELLTATVVMPSAAPLMAVDPPPDFSKLAANQKMREILARRWEECHQCLKGNAPLAATVMMGGLLEALCLARVNKMSDKAPLFKLKGTPLDKLGKPIPLPDWTLRPYLDVAHEIGWLTKSAKDVGAVLRDYRNYVHPQKEYSHGVALTLMDAAMFWDLTKNLCRQILES